MLSWQPLLPWFLKLIFDHSFKGAHAGCCLLACLLLACLLACCLLAACLLLACYLWLLLAACCLLLLAAACCCCLLLLAAVAACCCLLLLLAAACCCLLLLLPEFQYELKHTAHEILAGVVLRNGVHMGICSGGLGRSEASVKEKWLSAEKYNRACNMSEEVKRIL